MEIDALEQLISEDVKVQGQISYVMVSELASWSSESSPELLPESSPEEMRSTSTTLLPGSSLEESTLTSMRVGRFFLRVEEKTLPLHGGCRWSPPTWPLRACMASSPGLTKNRPLPWSAEEDARGRRAGTTPLRHRGTSLSWRGRRTTPRKTDGDLAAGASSLQNLPLESRAIPATETRMRQRRGRQKPEKGIEGRRQGRAFIKKGSDAQIIR
jgi:hypothetical protein